MIFEAIFIYLVINIILICSFLSYCKETNSEYKWWHIVSLLFFGVFIFTGWFILNKGTK